jgi:hypothetical protein
MSDLYPTWDDDGGAQTPDIPGEAETPICCCGMNPAPNVHQRCFPRAMDTGHCEGATHVWCVGCPLQLAQKSGEHECCIHTLPEGDVCCVCDGWSLEP